MVTCQEIDLNISEINFIYLYVSLFNTGKIYNFRVNNQEAALVFCLIFNFVHVFDC